MEQVFELREYSLNICVEGEGLPVLLLHSYWGNLRLFDPLVAVLSQKMKVIRIDLPGHGKSGPPPLNFTFDKFALVLNELLLRLEVREKISIVGHSMGGYAALAFATNYPGNTGILVLMHAPVKEADAKSIKLREQESHLLQKGKKDLFLKVTIPSNFAPENLDSMRHMVDRLHQSSSHVTLAGSLGTIHAINNRKNSLQVLQNATFPILIMIGKHDKVYRAKEQLNDASLIPSAEVLLLNHSGHLGFIEEEDLVIEKLQLFFESKLKSQEEGNTGY